MEPDCRYSFHLFAGAGGGILADLLSGREIVGAIEIEEYPRRVLLQRQADGLLPSFPIWDDVRSFSVDNEETKEYVALPRSAYIRLMSYLRTASS